MCGVLLYGGKVDRFFLLEFLLTLFAQAEVLQRLVQVSRCGDGSDIAVGTDRSQARGAGRFPHWRQAASL